MATAAAETSTSETRETSVRAASILAFVELDFDSCLRASASRDSRFDGRFFIGVHSTGVYCRPICPAPTPKPTNVRFYPTAAAAEAAGLRPCRRCRPETAPGTPEWIGGSAIATRALRLIGQGYLDRHGVLDLARELHVSERQLRRLFKTHLGAGPVAVARVRRAQVARMLLDQTDLGMTQVAFGAGYASVRQFNAELRRAFGRTPTELRRARRSRAVPADGDALRLRLPYRPPLAWRQLLLYLAARAIPGVEAVDSGVYRRSVRLAGDPGIVELEDDPERSQILLRLEPPVVDGIAGAVERARHVADLDADPLAIEAALAQDPTLGPLVQRVPGTRVPGCWEPFELAVRAILGQQVTVRGATTLAGRLVRSFGEALPEANGSVTHLFPTAPALVEADIAQIGMPETRAAAIRALARAFRDGDVPLDTGADPAEAIAALEALPGVGRWTARYVAMRAVRDPDAFPASDLGLRHALATNARPASAGEVAAAAEPWRPWRAYAAVHLWQGLSPALEEAA